VTTPERPDPDGGPDGETLLRRAWRARLDEAFPYPGESFWREADAWATTWDGVAGEFQTHVPAAIGSARRLERVVGNLRRRLEVAFVDVDPAEAARANAILRRLSREADLALGWPKAAKKRRRYKLMFFVDECVQAGLTEWPDFEAHAKTGDPNTAFIPADGPDGEPGWRRLVDLGLLRASLAELDDLSAVPPKRLHALVLAWRDRRPGAKKSLGAGSKVSAYEALHLVLKAAWGDATRPDHLKKEWSAANRPR
jgi:hypothetical protein